MSKKMHGNHRLLLFVPSFGQVLFDHYSNQSNAAFTPEDEDGLPETFDYTHPFLPSTMSYSDGCFRNSAATGHSVRKIWGN